MTEQLVGKTAIVTGASSGIGTAIAKELAGACANAVLAARNEEKLAAIAADIGQEEKTLCVKTDITKQKEVDTVAERTKEAFGSVDIYVNNAGKMHYVGMRISRINARNTSALAFDGSGKLTRNNKKDLATFTTEKVYHADLSASYNIGARYFIRGIQKCISEKKWLALQAKVPELSKRTQQTLSSLIALHLAQ
ncbi:SDR family NAD(P)-dependent oxidoreductase [Lentibacillus amyloliquefaciens]|uniref:Short-chain dehydrogenase n=1 Tax=Lentibacillus amyloliquefaciens TaxID=1472767 RepID=A0A0U4F072_9BACI|nr:SDR family NAD(P)-dependent oxidoreductase [Lentibacillus amyloliquefaciens]ALX48935.1 hypothetical protein AOX59_10100 [Lentibacillus amyloliquefaciens]